MRFVPVNGSRHDAALFLLALACSPEEATESELWFASATCLRVTPVSLGWAFDLVQTICSPLRD